MIRNRNVPTDKHKTNLPLMILVVLAFLVLVPAAAIAISAKDPVWFISGFQELPYRVVVYQGGQSKEYMAGQEGYVQLAEGVRASLDGGVLRASGIGLSKESLDDAYNKYTSVEAFFSGPVKLHASFNTNNPNQMLFLITGRHTTFPIVLMGEDGYYYSNSPLLKTNEPLRAALLGLGYDLTPVD